MYLKLIVKLMKNHLRSYLSDLLKCIVYKRDLLNYSTLLLKRKYKLSRYGKR